MRYDVIVVGAGPGGSTAARECAERGLSALLLDKAEFPRDKPCGGGVNVRSARLLPFDLRPVVERTIHSVRLSVRQRGAFTLSSPEPLTYLTQRSRLDAFLAERATAAGATFREGAGVRAVERAPAHITVRAGREAFEGRTLVAADGVNGQTAKLAGIQTRRWLLAALEGNAYPEDGFPRAWETAMALDGDAIPGGYGWLFPKGDHLNIGVGGWQVHGAQLRARLERISRYYGYDPASLRNLRGYRLPVRKPGSPLADGNVLLVGDAAGVLDPLTGEGIFGAIWSGRTAAAHIAAYLDGAAADPGGYVREVRHEMLPELSVSLSLWDLFYLLPGTTTRVLRHTPGLWGLLCDVVRGDRTYADLPRRRKRLAATIDIASELIHRTPRWKRLVDLADPPSPERALWRPAAGAS